MEVGASWGKRVPSEPSLDIIVPEFNELSRQGEHFGSQMRYLSEVSQTFDVFLVDDASSDGSWERIVHDSDSGVNHDRLHLIRMKENGRKVLAIKRALQLSKAEYVLLTDFDSRIVTFSTIFPTLDQFRRSPRLAALSLRVIPEGHSLFSRMQDVEYAISRGLLNRYLDVQRKLRCVCGAGSIWRRDFLLEILKEHSGRHNGDDMEATAIAMRKGYQVGYEPSVVVKTIVPQSPKEFYKQRRRWDLGALETYDKERRFYLREIKKITNRLGQITMLDWYSWITMVLFPYFIFNVIFNGIYHLSQLIEYQSIQLASAGIIAYAARHEVQRRWELLLIPVLPFYLMMETVPRFAALCQFISDKISRLRHTLRLRPLSLSLIPLNTEKILARKEICERMESEIAA